MVQAERETGSAGAPGGADVAGRSDIPVPPGVLGPVTSGSADPAATASVRHIDLVRETVLQLGLVGAAIVRIGPDGQCKAVSSWPESAPIIATDEACAALTALAVGRRGVGVWRPGSRTFADLARIAGAGVTERAALIVAVRVSMPVVADPEIMVVLSGDGARDADVLAREIARLNAPPLPGGAVEVRADPRMARLVNLGLQLAGELDVDRLLVDLVAHARELFDAEYAAIGVLDPSGTTIERFEVSGMDAALRSRIGPSPTGRGLLGALLEDPRPVRLERIADDRRSCGFPAHHPPMDTFLGVPILLGGVVFGNLYMTQKRSGPFTLEDERLAQVFAAQAAVTIDNALRIERERTRAAALEELQGTVRAVQDVLAEGVRTQQSLDEILAAVVAQLNALSGADGAFVALGDGDKLVIRAAHGIPATARATGRRCAPSTDAVRDMLCDLLEVPVEAVELRVGSELVGVLAAAGEVTAEFGVQAVMRAVASQLSLALASERARAVASALDVARERERATAEGFRRAILAQETERSRIARELHDEAGQVMMAVALHLRALEKSTTDPQQRADLEELHGIVAEAAEGLHEMISELRPGQLREHGLAAAIDQQVARTREATGIEIDLHLEALPELPEEVEIALYRIVQEALVNVARHSGASAASVTAARIGPQLRLVIEDNGRGFDPRAATARHGLLGMSERMALLGGYLHVDASPGGGTAIIAELAPGAMATEPPGGITSEK